MKRVCVVDTMFSRVDTGAAAVRELESFAAENDWEIEIERRTVPGFKDLAVECVRAFDAKPFDICMALGWVGGMPIDSQCAHEAATSIAQAQLLLRTHILEVFIHESETADAAELKQIALKRTTEHARNALYLVFQPQKLTEMAGTGQRQGGPSVGPLSAV